MKRLLVVGLLAAAAAVFPAVAGAATFRGVVVARQSGVLLVAGPSGSVRAFSGQARVGARVVLSGQRLRVVGLARRAQLRGVVVRRSGGLVFLSAARHVLAVRSSRLLASGGDTPTGPQPGDVVSAQVGINDEGDLSEQEVEDVGHQGGTSVQAVVSAVAPGSVTLTVNGQQLTIPLPAGLSLPATLVGTQVELQLSFAGGEATAASATEDDQGEDQQGDSQDQSSGDDQSGSGQTSGDGPQSVSSSSSSSGDEASGASSDQGDAGSGGGDG